MSSRSRSFAIALLLLTAPALAAAARAQEAPASTGPVPTAIEVTPAELRLEVGETAELEALVRDADGAVIEGATVLFFSLSRRQVGVTPAGQVEAYAPGEFELMARVPSEPDVDIRRDRDALSLRVRVVIPDPPLESLQLSLIHI